jgi:hypothetical protein
VDATSCGTRLFFFRPTFGLYPVALETTSLRCWVTAFLRAAPFATAPCIAESRLSTSSSAIKDADS